MRWNITAHTRRTMAYAVLQYLPFAGWKRGRFEIPIVHERIRKSIWCNARWVTLCPTTRLLSCVHRWIRVIKQEMCRWRNWADRRLCLFCRRVLAKWGASLGVWSHAHSIRWIVWHRAKRAKRHSMLKVSKMPRVKWKTGACRFSVSVCGSCWWKWSRWIKLRFRARSTIVQFVMRSIHLVWSLRSKTCGRSGIRFSSTKSVLQRRRQNTLKYKNREPECARLLARKQSGDEGDRDARW